MTDDDKQEMKRCFDNWLRDSDFEERVRIIIKHLDTEKYIKRSEQWLDRIPFALIGLAIGVIAALILSAHH